MPLVCVILSTYNLQIEQLFFQLSLDLCGLRQYHCIHVTMSFFDEYQYNNRESPQRQVGSSVDNMVIFWRSLAHTMTAALSSFLRLTLGVPGLLWVCCIMRFSSVLALSLLFTLLTVTGRAEPLTCWPATDRPTVEAPPLTQTGMLIIIVDSTQEIGKKYN